jgi:uncharacterized damage-inducible protein DinB
MHRGYLSLSLGSTEEVGCHPKYPISIAKQGPAHAAHYSAWASLRLLEACAAVTAEEFERDLRASHGGVAGTLRHIHYAERVWLKAAAGELTSCPDRGGRPAAISGSAAGTPTQRPRTGVAQSVERPASRLENLSESELDSELLYYHAQPRRVPRLALETGPVPGESIHSAPWAAD